jgi:hypothetical protein
LIRSAVTEIAQQNLLTLMLEKSDALIHKRIGVRSR